MQKRRATASKEMCLSKPILQRTATPGNRHRRIVALEEVAGSSPVGHPPGFRIGKPGTRKGKESRCGYRDYLTPLRLRQGVWGRKLGIKTKNGSGTTVTVEVRSFRV